MPALPPVPKVLRIRFIGKDAADNEVGTHLNVEYGGGAPTVAQLNSFGGSVISAWNSGLQALVDTGFTATSVQTQDLSSPTSAEGLFTTSDGGTRSGTPLPLSICFSIQYQTALRRRGGHWHGQWRAGVQADTATTQTWTSSFVTTFLGGFQTFITALLGSPWSGGGPLTHVGVQYYGPPNRTITSSTGRVRTVSTLLATPVVYPVTGYGAFVRLGSQRRRLGKG